MDFITGLPKFEEKSVIMVVVDRLTNYAQFSALSHPFKAITVATTFMDRIQKLHRIPRVIVSDRDPMFTGNFWTKLFSCLGTQLATSVRLLTHISSTHGKPETELHGRGRLP